MDVDQEYDNNIFAITDETRINFFALKYFKENLVKIFLIY